MTIALVIILTVVIIFLLAAIAHINKIVKELNQLGKEQHDQNMDIIRLMKENHEVKGMLLQHIEILKYLCEQDPILGKVKMPYTGPIGQA